MSAPQFDHVDYDVLDEAKNAFIQASRCTLDYAKEYGFIPSEKLGASANVFMLDLKPYLATGSEQLFVTLVPEGLGTADDARPDDLSSEELERFWHNIAYKTMGVLTNDAAATGMQTVLISLYLPSARPEVVFSKEFMKGFLDGFTEACKKVQCVYFSGETPQLKNKLYPDKLDIAGALWGVMPPGITPIESSALAPGDRIVFVESAGPDANGFTGLRTLTENLPQGYRTPLPSGKEYWEAINAPTKLYTPFVQDMLKRGIRPTNIEPITGHGWQKIMRPSATLRYVIEEMLPVPEIFEFVGEKSGMSPQEMIKIFNYGVGMAICVRSEGEAQSVVKIAEDHDIRAIIAGKVEKSESREVVVKPLDTVLESSEFQLKK